jgi:hypothetical protein
VNLLVSGGSENGYAAPNPPTPNPNWPAQSPQFLSPKSPSTPPIAGVPFNLLANPTLDWQNSRELFLSRYDMAYMPMDYCRRQIQVMEANLVPWWQNISGLDLGATNLRPLSNTAFQHDQSYYAKPYPNKPGPSDSRAANYGTNTPDWMSAWAAQTAPIFVRGCTQFIVEFAGDYATQDPVTGNVTSAYPDTDGQIDYIIDATGKRRIRWYGFPRDTATDSNITGVALNNGSPVPDGAIGLWDVIPVAWYLRGSLPAFTRQLPFERDVPDSSGPMSSFTMGFTQTSAASNSPRMVTPPYVCAWGPNTAAALRPKMIRITIGIDEPNGRLGTKQIYEFIYKLP